MDYRLKKYFKTLVIGWQEIFIYRFNFLLWRFRSFLHFLTIYFFWLAVFSKNVRIFDYEASSMLTYILGTSLIRTFVLGSRSIDIAGQIASGSLSNWLLKPISYFRFWQSRDLADKSVNFFCVIFEMGIFFAIFSPPIFWQKDLIFLFAFLLASLLAMVLYFYTSLLISLTTFWYPEDGGWPARFLFTVILEFLSGGLFPLDIFPKGIFLFLKNLPFCYLLFFPVQVYLGRLSSFEIFSGITMMALWIFILKKGGEYLWVKGLKSYEAIGI